MQVKTLKNNNKEKPVLLYYTNVDWSFVSHRLDLAKAAINAGYEVHLLTNITNSRNIIENSGIIIHESYLSRRFNLFRDFLGFFKLIYIILRLKPKIIHNVSNKNILVGGVIARLFRIDKIVLAVSGLGYIYINKNLFTSTIKAIINRAYNIILKHPSSYIIVQNHDDYAIISSIFKNKKNYKKIILIPGSGVNVNYFKPNHKIQNKVIISLVARMIYDKGIQEFIDAAKNITKRYKKVEFNLYGNPDKSNPKSISLKRLKEWNLNKNINWKGFSNDTRLIYNSSDIIVLPSYREGMPKSILEASSCGRPSIVTNVPGCRDSIIPNKTGLLVNPYDVNDLISKIEYLIENINLRELMGIEARKLALKKFDIKIINSQQLEIYRK